MEATQVVELGRDALWLAVLLGAPLLGIALIVGVLIGVIQAATSVNEMTLSFIHQARGARSRASARRELAAGAPGGLHAGTLRAVT